MFSVNKYFILETCDDLIMAFKTAIWEKDKERFTVTFNSAGGSSVPSQTVLEGNKATKPSKHKQTRIKVIIYMAFTPFLSNVRSAKPHIKKAKDTILAPKPVKTIQFSLLFLKQQNKGAIPIY